MYFLTVDRNAVAPLVNLMAEDYRKHYAALDLEADTAEIVAKIERNELFLVKCHGFRGAEEIKALAYFEANNIARKSPSEINRFWCEVEDWLAMCEKRGYGKEAV